jgi:hypothetical protein
MQNNKTTNEFRTLAKIRERKEELLEEIQKDTEKVTALWNDTFVKRDEVSKGDFIASLIGNGFMAFDAFLLARKLIKGYGYLFGKGKRKKTK